MLMKLLGSLMVLSSCTLIGIFISSRDKYRAEELIEMKRGLIMLKSSISYNSKPLYEAFIEISEKLDSAVSEIFEDSGRLLKARKSSSVEEAWEKTLKDRKNRTFFKNEDIKTFISFGQALGGADRQWQSSNIDLTVNYIDSKVDELMKRYEKDGSLFKSAGILCGILLVVVLY